jgi:enterochelin esterase-like enzyme
MSKNSVSLAKYLLTSAALMVMSVAAQARADAMIESPRLGALSRQLAAGDSQALDAFWQQIAREHTPLIEPASGKPDQMLVTFLWRAAPGQENLNIGVSEVGEGAAIDPATRRLARLTNSDVWYRTYRVSDRARFAYSLLWPQGRLPDPQAFRRDVEGGVTYELFDDPLNPKAFSMQFNEKSDATTWIDQPSRRSYAEGPHAPAEPYVAERPNVARGTVATFELDSAILGNRRRISIYTPPGAPRGDSRCNFLLVFDRAAYLTGVPTPTILDNMLADGVLRPTVAVLVGNAEPPARGRDLPPNAQFQAFLKKELLPWVRARYRYTNDPRRSVVAGASYGGLAAAYTALMNPDVFGGVLSQSGSYWWWPQFSDDTATYDLTSDAGWVARQYVSAPKLPLRFYMDVGTWEGIRMLLPNRTFRDVLQARGYEVAYQEFDGGHDFPAWRATFPTGLTTLLGAPRK